MPQRINHLAAWVAALVYFVFGAIWYGALSGPWQAYMGGKGAPSTPGLYIGSFILGLMLAYATADALARRPEDRTLTQGVSFALFIGIAVFATQTLNQALYEARPFGLWLIDAGYVVIGFALIGAIVGGWKMRAAQKG
jgi:hypothetical protein